MKKHLFKDERLSYISYSPRKPNTTLFKQLSAFQSVHELPQQLNNKICLTPMSEPEDNTLQLIVEKYDGRAKSKLKYRTYIQYLLDTLSISNLEYVITDTKIIVKSSQKQPCEKITRDSDWWMLQT